MLSLLRGTPLLSILLYVMFFGGPIAMVVREDFVKKATSAFREPAACAAVPSNVITYGASLVVLFTCRRIELIIGTLKTLLLVVLSYGADVGVRTLVALGREHDNVGSGPYGMISCLMAVYCVMFPVIKLRSLGKNEKYLLWMMIGCSCVFGGIRSVLAVVSGLIVFALTSPLFIPDEE